MKSNLRLGTIYLTISTFVFILSGYLLNIFIGRYLGPKFYGIYGIIMSLMTIINLIQVSGLPQAVSKYVAENETQRESVLKNGLIIQFISTLLASVIVFLFATQFAQLLHDQSLTAYIRAIAAIFPIYGIYTIYLNYYNGLHQFKTQAYMVIVYSLGKLLSVLILIYFFHIFGVIIGFVIAPLFVLIAWSHIPRIKSDYSFYKPLLFFSFPLIGYAIFSNLLQSIDLFFVKSVLHTNEFTGYYTANQNIAEIPFYAVTALSSVIFPNISKKVSQNKILETKIVIRKALRFCLVALIPSVLLISFTSKELLSFLYSSAYRPGAQSLTILSIGSCFFTIFALLATVISSSGQPKISAAFAGIGVILSSIFCIFLVPKYGLNGAALSTTFASGLMMVAAAITIYKKFKVFISVKSSLKIIFASLFTSCIAKLIPIPTLLLPLVYIFLSLCYFLLLYIFREITVDDTQLIKSLIPSWIPLFNK